MAWLRISSTYGDLMEHHGKVYGRCASSATTPSPSRTTANPDRRSIQRKREDWYEHPSPYQAFMEVDRSKDPDFFVRFMDEAQKPEGIHDR